MGPFLIYRFMIDFLGGQYLVLATSTGIGKTYFVSEACAKLRKKGVAVNAIKPVISGFDALDLDNDVFKIASGLGIEYNEQNIDKISPFRFKGAFSALKAARIEGLRLDFEDVAEFCKESALQAKKNSETLFIEGAGGVMSPINEDFTFLDLAAHLEIPVILIAGVFLGEISHSLCAIEALKSRGIEALGLIVNDYNAKDGLAKEDISSEIEEIGGVKCLFMQDLEYFA